MTNIPSFLEGLSPLRNNGSLRIIRSLCWGEPSLVFLSFGTLQSFILRLSVYQTEWWLLFSFFAR